MFTLEWSPWSRVIAPFNHCICGSRPAVSSAFITIKKAISGGSMQCRWQDQIHATPYPKPTEATTTLSSTMIYCRRKLEQSSNKSNNCVAVEKEIRRKKCPSKPGTIPLPTQPCIWTYVSHLSTYPTPQPDTPSVASFLLKFIMSCSP